MSITFYGLLAYIGWHSIKNSTIKWMTIIFLLVWILAIGASRIYLRKHYYSDVIAGLALGFLWLVVSLIVIRLIEKRSKQKLNRVVEQAPEPVADHPNA
jgi:undecaprenyl-diphosphatase